MKHNNSIETIINEYLNNDFPEEIQSDFQEWIMDTKNQKEKDEILFKHAFSNNKDFNYKQYQEKLKKLNNEIDNQKIRNIKAKFSKYSLITVAASLLVVVLTFALVKSWSQKETIVYVTSEHGKGDFMLPDGSSVILNASSKLKIPSNFSKNNRNVTLDGEGYFSIVKDSLNEFRVYSNLATIKVLGTEFNMKAYSDKDYAEVVLVKGSVEVSGSSLSKPIIMKPNERITLNKTAKIGDVQVGNYTSWTGKKLKIENKELKDILTNIEHWYNVDFIPNGNVDLSPRLTFVINDENLESVLYQISLVTSFQYKIKDDKIIYSTEK